MEAREQLEMHSEELGEVLGTPPRWLVRWGTTIALFTFVTLLAVAYFVKYPDIITADLVITAPNPPVNLIANQAGLLEAVLVRDDETVEEGDLLLVYSSTANMIDIDSLEADLKYFSGEIYARDIEVYTPMRNLQLGSLQEEYSDFLKNYDGFTYGAVNQNDQKQINRLNGQIRNIEASIDLENDKRKGISLREQMAKDEHARIQKNYSSAPDRYRETLGQSAQKIKDIEQEYDNLKSIISRKKLNIKNLERQIIDIRQQSKEDNSTLVFTIADNINRLKAKVKAWKAKNLMYAPIAGRVIFYKEFDNENQSVLEGTKILQIIPPGDIGEMYGKVDLPQAGSGKVDVGQEVVIKFDNYPFHEYGAITGRVLHKSDIPQENNKYKLEVELINGLRTSTGKELKFNQGMQGTAEIITKERRFLFRLFENVFDF